MALFNFFKKSVKIKSSDNHRNTRIKIEPKKLSLSELGAILPSLSLHLDNLLTPELFLLSDQERGSYGFVISFEGQLSLTGIKDDNTVDEQTWLLSRKDNNTFIFDLVTPYTGQPISIALPENFIYDMIVRVVEGYPESFSYEEFSKACVISGTKFIKEQVAKEIANKEKFEFEKEYYHEKYGHKSEHEKSLFLQAKKDYKNFDQVNGSPFAEKILEDLVELNPFFASAQFFLAVVRIQNWNARKIHLELFGKMSRYELEKLEEEVIRKSSANFTKAILLNPYYKEDMLDMQRRGLI